MCGTIKKSSNLICITKETVRPLFRACSDATPLLILHSSSVTEKYIGGCEELNYDTARTENFFVSTLNTRTSTLPCAIKIPDDAFPLKKNYWN